MKALYTLAIEGPPSHVSAETCHFKGYLLEFNEPGCSISSQGSSLLIGGWQHGGFETVRNQGMQR